jgi:hypothetical protein
MIVYSAGSPPPKKHRLQIEQQSGQSNLLLSYAYKECQAAAVEFCQQPQRKLLIDSGAFTAWTDNKVVNLDEYISFCQNIKDTAKCPVEFISLDVIAGSKNEDFRPDEAVFQAACEQGWKNFVKMKKAGIVAIPTLHQFDDDDNDFGWLQRMIGEAEYIALSPRKRNGGDTDYKLEWLRKIFTEAAGLGKRFHALGVAQEDVMEDFPFFSADNTMWTRSSKGLFCYFDGRRIRRIPKAEWQNPIPGKDYSCDDGTDAIAKANASYSSKGNYGFITHALEADAKLSRFLTQLWAERGLPDGKVVPHENHSGTICHLCASAELYSQFRRLGDWRLVAKQSGQDQGYVNWAVQLGRQTDLWQQHHSGKLDTQNLAELLWYQGWDKQLNYFDRELYLEKHPNAS